MAEAISLDNHLDVKISEIGKEYLKTVKHRRPKDVKQNNKIVYNKQNLLTLRGGYYPSEQQCNPPSEEELMNEVIYTVSNTSLYKHIDPDLLPHLVSQIKNTAHHKNLSERQIFRLLYEQNAVEQIVDNMVKITKFVNCEFVEDINAYNEEIIGRYSYRPWYFPFRPKTVAINWLNSINSIAYDETLRLGCKMAACKEEIYANIVYVVSNFFAYKPIDANFMFNFVTQITTESYCCGLTDTQLYCLIYEKDVLQQVIKNMMKLWRFRNYEIIQKVNAYNEDINGNWLFNMEHMSFQNVAKYTTPYPLEMIENVRIGGVKREPDVTDHIDELYNEIIYSVSNMCAYKIIDNNFLPYLARLIKAEAYAKQLTEGQIFSLLYEKDAVHQVVENMMKMWRLNSFEVIDKVATYNWQRIGKYSYRSWYWPFSTETTSIGDSLEDRNPSIAYPSETTINFGLAAAVIVTIYVSIRAISR